MIRSQMRTLLEQEAKQIASTRSRLRFLRLVMKDVEMPLPAEQNLMEAIESLQLAEKYIDSSSKDLLH